jgi:1-acyl-sn-glycerol-3-phosphate acyltransferase
VILAPNHFSFMDHFFLGAFVRRKVRFMAKSQLFKPPLQFIYTHGGVFPVRRGHRDDEMFKTAHSLLSRGKVIVMYDEGGRSRTGELQQAKPGIGRLALETGAPLIPAAITGTEDLWAGPLPKPKRVQVTFAAPIPVAELAATPDEAGSLVEDVLWPEVEAQFGRLLLRPGVIAALLAAVGVGGGIALRRPRASSGPPWRRRRRRRLSLRR